MRMTLHPPTTMQFILFRHWYSRRQNQSEKEPVALDGLGQLRTRGNVDHGWPGVAGYGVECLFVCQQAEASAAGTASLTNAKTTLAVDHPAKMRLSIGRASASAGSSVTFPAEQQFGCA